MFDNYKNKSNILVKMLLLALLVFTGVFQSFTAFADTKGREEAFNFSGGDLTNILANVTTEDAGGGNYNSIFELDFGSNFLNGDTFEIEIPDAFRYAENAPNGKYRTVKNEEGVEILKWRYEHTEDGTKIKGEMLKKGAVLGDTKANITVPHQLDRFVLRDSGTHSFTYNDGGATITNDLDIKFNYGKNGVTNKRYINTVYVDQSNRDDYPGVEDGKYFKWQVIINEDKKLKPGPIIVRDYFDYFDPKEINMEFVENGFTLSEIENISDSKAYDKLTSEILDYKITRDLNGKPAEAEMKFDLEEGKTYVIEALTKPLPSDERYENAVQTIREGGKEPLAQSQAWTVELSGSSNAENDNITDIPVQKVWENDTAEDRPEEITVELLRNDEVAETAVLNADNDWSHVFEEMPKSDGKNIVYEYTVKELPVEGYTAQVEGDMNSGFTITNTFVEPTPPTIEKDVNGEDAIEIGRAETFSYNVNTTIPENVTGYETLSVTDVLDDRLTVDSVTVKVDGEDSDFEATVEGQKVSMAFDKAQLETLAGKEINLVINAQIKEGTEVGSIDNTASFQLNDNPSVDSNTVTVTVPEVEMHDIEVVKVWEDEESEDRPEAITVDLLRNDEVIETVEITADTEWKHVFVELPKEDNVGNAYTYTVVEHEVEGYTSNVEATENGFVVTNTLVEVPVVEEPTEPTEPEEPIEEEPVQPEEPVEPAQPKQPIKEGWLPSTGTEMNYVIIFIGMSLLAAAGYALYRVRKSQS